MEMLPVCMPMRNLSWSSGRCLIVKLCTADRSASDIRAISQACKLPLRTGSPETTM